MSQNQAKFESFLWQLRLYQLERTFQVLDSFLVDEQSQQMYLERKYENKQELSNMLDHIEDSVQFLPDGVQVFRRQMVVLLATYSEQILKEFFENFFIANPEKIPKDLPESEPQNELPNVAMRKAMKGGMVRILKRIERLSDTKITEKGTLIDLVNEKRNSIVHDFAQEEIDPQFLTNNIDALKKLIDTIDIICSKNGIKVVIESGRSPS